MSKVNPVVAVDLDHTIIHPETEEPYPGAVEALQEFRRRGWKIIIFTLRDNVEDVKSILDKLKAPFDAVNENLPGMGTKSPKVYYDVLIDDRALSFNGSWSNAVASAERRVWRRAGRPRRLLVKRLNSGTRYQQVVAEILLDNDGSFGKIRKSGSGDGLLEEVLDVPADCDPHVVLQRLLALNGSRLWVETR